MRTLLSCVSIVVLVGCAQVTAPVGRDAPAPAAPVRVAELDREPQPVVQPMSELLAEFRRFGGKAQAVVKVTILEDGSVADAVLVNTAIAVAPDACRMAIAFNQAVEAGRTAFEVGLGAPQTAASATSPSSSASASWRATT